MTNYLVKTVDEYIAAAPAAAWPHLEEIRTAVKSAIPQADEKIGYGKPYYKAEKWIAGFDVYTSHIGFELWGEALPDDDRKALEEMGYKTGSRSFQIRHDQNVPTEMIKKLVKAQI